MAKKASNYFKRVSQYQKEHPRADRAKAMKAVSKEISGKRKPSKTKTKTAKPRKRSITKTERIVTIGKKKRTISTLQRSVNIAKKINDLEILLKCTTGTAEKNHLKRLINAEHDKLDVLKHHLKSA